MFQTESRVLRVIESRTNRGSCSGRRGMLLGAAVGIHIREMEVLIGLLLRELRLHKASRFRCPLCSPLTSRRDYRVDRGQNIVKFTVIKGGKSDDRQSE